ncbi:initiation factor 2 [Acrodontium crateriforme]|uniref:Translation initiation factor IF-2, mitochondrial n=1 Tax=Acrodontium crateriforme TaxID=150365 RepID=A0AAQ3M0Y5_9PEZI|nr:initiation factor 2 [Acrodontium crateriforme]
MFIDTGISVPSSSALCILLSMRRNRLLKPSSAQDLCVFCACRLSAELAVVPPSLVSRRRLNTTRPPFQNAAATQRIEENSSSNGVLQSSPQWAGFDLNSPLSISEQNERNRLKELRAARENQEKNARALKEKYEQQRTQQAARSTKQRSPTRKVDMAALIGGHQSLHRVDLNSAKSKPQPNVPSRRQTLKLQPEQVGLPDFMRVSAQSNERRTEDANGWGLGKVERTPLTHAEREARSDVENGHSANEEVQAIEKEKNLDKNTASDNASGKSFFRFKPSEKETQTPSNSPLERDQGSNWQHLRRTGQENSSQVTFSFGQQTEQTEVDDDWIDRRFREHQEQRKAKSPIRHPNSRGVVATDTMQSVKRCGRCLEDGHAARDCTGPVRSKCHHCGEVGHMSSSCPAKKDFHRSRGRNSRHNANSETVQKEYLSRSQNYNAKSDASGSNKHHASDLAERDPSMGRRGLSADLAARDNDEKPVKRRFEKQTEPSSEEPEQRVLRSRKFSDEGPKKSKLVRRSRNDDYDDEGAAERDERNARKAARKAEKEQQLAAEEAERKARRDANGVPITLPPFISVATLAQALGVRYENFVGQLARLGYDDIFPGKILNSEISSMIAMEYNFDPSFDSVADEAEERDLLAQPELADKSLLPVRPPVVTIMGHVDHGKTTILDYLRKSSVAAGEAGGITQHIGAFSVPLAASGKSITFLDTPGHAAFLAMRQRGANVTDIVILVVAADDSVKPQTLEAIKHAKSAGVPVIVAVNKIDKPEANLEQVKQDLSRHGIEIEDYGGETQVVPVSGKTGKGMDELEEAIVTLSEILDHRAETDGMVEGWVLEATTKDRGRVATVLVRRGTLKQGDVIVAGKTWARVRTLRNESGQVLSSIGPGMPVEVDGWRDQPSAGDEVLEAPTEQKATNVIEYRVEKEEREKALVDMEAINEARKLGREKHEKDKETAKAVKLAKRAGIAIEKEETEVEEQQTGQIEVPFIIKADVSGSAEAVAAYILSVSSPLIIPKILESTVGPVHESDVDMAATAGGHIIAFNLPSNEGMKGAAMSAGVQILENNIIYRVLDDVKAVLEERLPAVVTQKVSGEAEISASFEIGIGGRKTLKIAGCKVRNGVITKGSRVRVLRGEQKVYDGLLSSLKNVKKDVQEMRKGTECGMGFDEWAEFEVGDMVQTYLEITEKRKL